MDWDDRRPEIAQAFGQTARVRFMPREIVAHYRIDHPLGTGGMGVVYLAQDTLLSRQVALKMLLGPSEHSDARESLLREG
jgi:eukaryotic-like serine/threonine-protein kinase